MGAPYDGDQCRIMYDNGDETRYRCPHQLPCPDHPITQECGFPRCANYGQPDGPRNQCPDDHIQDRHPATDPRWRPATFRYRNDKLEIIEVTQTPIDNESALANFHTIASYGDGFEDVTYIEKCEPDSDEFKMMPYKFVNGTVEKVLP